MSITIQLNPDLEKQLKSNAAQIGVEPEQFVTKILQEQLRQISDLDEGFIKKESELLHKISLGIAEKEWNLYSSLIQKRDNGKITEVELPKLIALSDKVENANVERIKNLIKLANLRGVTLTALMGELGIKPLQHG